MRKRYAVLFLVFLPVAALASVNGIDDITPNISEAEQSRIDNAITTYYRNPTVEKVNTVLDIMSEGQLVRKKTAWVPLVGFLSIVFAENKNHVMAWISRNDYNSYAEDIIITALLHARLKETALIFAQASQWKEEDINRVRAYEDKTDFKHLPIVLPSHIDTLWGVFFASGDPVYVNEIIDVLFMTSLPYSDIVIPPEDKDVLGESKALARSSLTRYAASDAVVHAAIEKRIAEATNPEEREILRKLLSQSHT